MNSSIPAHAACSLALCLMLCALPAAALPNGGPIDGNAIQQTGAIRLVNAPDILLLAEELRVVLEEDLAHVEVRYTLRNQGPAADVAFGFPISFVKYMSLDLGQEPALESFALLDNGQELAWREAAASEPAAVPQCLIDLAEVRDNLMYYVEHEDIELEWLTSSMAFAAGEDKELVVRYTVRTQFYDEATSKDFLPGYSPRVFLYDFSPAAGWGDGTMDSLDVSVDFSHNLDLGMELLRIAPAGFQDQGGGVYTLHMDDVGIADLCTLALAYDVNDWKVSQYVLAHRVPAQNVTLTASSAQEGYPASNLLDNDPATAWVPEGDGVGAWLRVEVRDANVAGIMLLNGYAKSPALHLANSRAAAMDLEIAILDWQGDTRDTARHVELPDLPFDAFRPESFAALAQTVAYLDMEYLAPAGMTMTVTEVYPGAQYQDLCLSELYLVTE